MTEMGQKVIDLSHLIPHCHMANVWVLDGQLKSRNSRCMEWTESTDDDLKLVDLTLVDKRIMIEHRQGILGMVLDSQSKACFCRNISEFSIADQPIAYYQRRMRCEACFVICLKNLHTEDLYVLEFFLNQSPATNEYLLSFFSFLLPILKNELKTFELASGKKLGEEELVVEVIEFSEANQLSSSSHQLDAFPIKFKSVLYSQKEHQQRQVQSDSEIRQIEQGNAVASSSQKTEKGKKKTRHNLTREDLEPHFGKKLDDAAKELGGE